MGRINWNKWEKEVLKKAKKEEKLIFLNISNEVCESCDIANINFLEDDDIIKFLEKECICIKVDADKRVDVSTLYIEFGQMLDCELVFPLNILMTPEQKPFFAFNLYDESNENEIRNNIEMFFRKWEKDKESIYELAEKVFKKVKRALRKEKSEYFDSDLIKRTFKSLKVSYDEENGGFQIAPKFTAPNNILFLLKYYEKNSNDEILKIIEKTLESMYVGNIFDKKDGAFYSYAIDEAWNFPEGKKEVSNNGLLMMSYTKAYEITKNKIYKEVVEYIFKYLIKELYPKNEIIDFEKNKEEKFFKSSSLGIIIAAFSYAGKIFGNELYIAEAKKILRENAKFDENLRFKTLDDYAFYIWGLVELYETSNNEEYILKIEEFLDLVEKLFKDEKHGGYFLTKESEEFIIRWKEAYDMSIPSGNSVMAMNLMRVGNLVRKLEYLKRAADIFLAFSQVIREYPEAYTFIMTAYVGFKEDYKEK